MGGGKGRKEWKEGREGRNCSRKKKEGRLGGKVRKSWRLLEGREARRK